MDSKNRISVFLLAFWIPILVSKLLYFSRIIPNQITENVNIHWYWNFIQKFFGHFSKRWPRINTQRERKLGKFDSYRRISFVWRPLLTNLKGFHPTCWKIKNKQGWVIISIKYATWETYGAPHNEHLECLLVSLFMLAPPSF